MTKALYRKYRSKNLDEVVGQKHITDILKLSLEKGHIAHAYLLTGPRGVGKTSIARILAHEINKLPYTEESSHLDIIEIDAASNNGVEDVRDLREKVQIAPVSAAKKVYIIDEVHMLSKQAFNALLKTLEEPPAHVVFILATTDADKLPDTIVSRTQRFGFRQIGRADMLSHLAMIAKKEKIKIDEDALGLIAERGGGSFRDSIGLLDQLSSLSDVTGGITAELVETILGLAPNQSVKDLLAATEAKDIAKIVELIDKLEAGGTQGEVLNSQLITEVRSHIVERPYLIGLLEHLLEVSRSSTPHLKLLTVLVGYSNPKNYTKTAALAITQPSISVPLTALEKLATKPQFTNNEKVDTKTPEPPKKTVVEKKEQIKTRPKLKSGQKIDFEWNKLIEFTRKNYIAIYSVLSKCGYEVQDSTLVIYTGSAFYKKKLDDTKHRIDLSTALGEVCAFELLIETIPTKIPPKDEKAAAVAAIMGGGEEVSLEL